MDCPEAYCNTQSPEWAFHNLTRAHHQAKSALLDTLGLRDVGQPILLFILSDMNRSGSVCTQKELANLLRIAPSTLTVSVQSLERRGYLRKKNDENDLRRNHIEITPSGIEVANRCREAFTELSGAMYRGFSDDEKLQVTDFFSRMAANLFAMTGSDLCTKEDC